MTIFKPVLHLLLSFTYHWGIKPLQQAQMVERLPSQSSPQQHQCVCHWQTCIYFSFLSQQHPLVACGNIRTAIVIQDNPCEKKTEETTLIVFTFVCHNLQEKSTLHVLSALLCNSNKMALDGMTLYPLWPWGIGTSPSLPPNVDCNLTRTFVNMDICMCQSEEGRLLSNLFH